MASVNVKKLLPVLKRSQSKLKVLPRRILKSGSELEKALETAETVVKESPVVSQETTTETVAK